MTCETLEALYAMAVETRGTNWLRANWTTYLAMLDAEIAARQSAGVYVGVSRDVVDAVVEQCALRDGLAPFPAWCAQRTTTGRAA